MRVLAFHLGHDRYGLPLRRVRRVLPVVELKEVPLMPTFVAGLLDFHGSAVPVIDLAARAGLVPTTPCFDTRLLLVDYEQQRPLALLVSHVTGIETVPDDALATSGLATQAFLGDVVGGEPGMLQLIELDALIPSDVRALLYPEEAPA